MQLKYYSTLLSYGYKVMITKFIEAFILIMLIYSDIQSLILDSLSNYLIIYPMTT